MNISNETGDLILKVVGGIVAFFSLRWLIRLFAGSDHKLSLKEFRDLVAFVLFIWAFVKIILTEANRPMPANTSDHVFSDLWLFFIISALLSVLAKTEIFDVFNKSIELLIKLRTKVTYESDTTKSTTSNSSSTVRTSTGVPDSTEKGQPVQEGD